LQGFCILAHSSSVAKFCENWRKTAQRVRTDLTEVINHLVLRTSYELRLLAKR